MIWPQTGQKHRIACVAAVALSALGAAAVASIPHRSVPPRLALVAAETGPKQVAGELQALTSRRMAVDSYGETVLFRLSDQTRVTIDGRKAALRDLEYRQFVEVTAEERGPDLMASAIAARSRMQYR